MPSRGICAHRGAGDAHPENTLAAFREAVRLFEPGIEFPLVDRVGEVLLVADQQGSERLKPVY